MAQIEILNFLVRKYAEGNFEYFTISKIAKEVKTDVPNASKQIKKLVCAGWVERDLPIRLCAYRIRPAHYEYMVKAEKENPTPSWLSDIMEIVNNKPRVQYVKGK